MEQTQGAEWRGLVIIGGGAMARAIVEGGLAAGVLRPDWVMVAEPDSAKHGVFARLGVGVVAKNEDGLAWLSEGRGLSHRPLKAAIGGTAGDTDRGVVLLAVKPQSLGAVAADVRQWREHGNDAAVVSILAGTPTGKIEAAIGDGARVVRVMPNTPARVRRGVSAVCHGAGAREEDVAWATALFGALGSVVPIEEGLMDAFTAVAGSGPAYVFYLAEAMVQSAVALGFDAATADVIVRGTIAGAGELIRQSEETADQLLASVKSKGGTTEAAVEVLERESVTGAVVRALTAARDRGRALALGTGGASR